MILFPAIDIYDGKAVRLLGGDYGRMTVYGDPVDTAKRFRDAGAEWLHVVDLNGAANNGDNFAIVERIVTETQLKVQSGGGLRDKSKVRSLLDAGAERAVLGTVCVKRPELVGEIIGTFGAEAVVCGLDAKDGMVTVSGWTENSSVTPLDLGRKLRAYGAKYFLYTDVSRDGMLTGANIDATAALAEKLDACVIASGGIKDIADLRKIKERGVYGAIVGKAYYEKKIDIIEAVKLCMN